MNEITLGTGIIVVLLLVGVYVGLAYTFTKIDSAPSLWPFRDKRD